MGKRVKFGKVVLNHLGYSVRQMITTATNAKKQTIATPTGKYGIYAGKRLIIKDISDPKEAIPFIEGEIAGNQKKRAIALKKEEDRIKEINNLTKRTW